MKEWLTADEIADEALPHLPNTKRGVNKFVDANAWNTHPTYARKRQARGGGMEYQCSPHARG